MNSWFSDRNKVYQKLKRLRGQKSTSNPLKLVTPVGTYFGNEVLEGFAADAEHLGRARGEPMVYDNEFYRLCKADNSFIFEFKGEDSIRIPPMSLSTLEDIIFRRMKRGKACDVYQLTVEHLQYSGQRAKLAILNLINKILDKIYYLTCPQLKCGLGTAVHKGKKKPVDKSESYRRITVTPHIGSIIDRYIDPITEGIFRGKQNPDQFGFTAGTSYLLASVLRGECQRWAVDRKLTCFGVSLDGEAAFPSVDRDILLRELYSVGERGDIHNYSRGTYQNTQTQFKLTNKLSRAFKEHTGTRQGHVKASGHYKAYINPCLDTLNSTDLGFKIGPITVSVVCCADDAYLLSGRPSGLQGLINIIQHYARRYRVIFNASKTKIVVTGSKVDMQYYQDISPWTLGGGTVAVVTDNHHLGLVVSGMDEEQKNVDNNIDECRKSLFGLLGPALSYKCKLSPLSQHHLWTVYALPVLLSGLSALPIRPTVMKTLTLFHNKILRGFLKLSKSSPVPALYFLLGELPIEARVHIGLLTLFHNALINSNSKLFQVMQYILMMSDDKSTTWSVHVRLLSKLYELPDPLILTQCPIMSKEEWKTLITTRVTVYHEKLFREKAAKNSRLQFLNVQLLSLSGRPHPSLLGITETRQVQKLRAHLQLLTGDFPSFELLGHRQNSDQQCRLCFNPIESIQHIITECSATADARNRIFPELLNLVLSIDPTNQLLQPNISKRILTQFVLDPTSFNLSNEFRISFKNPRLHELFSLSRDWCFSVTSLRRKLLSSKNI